MKRELDEAKIPKQLEELKAKLKDLKKGRDQAVAHSSSLRKECPNCGEIADEVDGQRKNSDQKGLGDYIVGGLQAISPVLQAGVQAHSYNNYVNKSLSAYNSYLSTQSANRQAYINQGTSLGIPSSPCQNYIDHRTKRLLLAEKRWLDRQTDEDFALWLSEYGDLYFSPGHVDAGRLLLARDPVSAAFYRSNGDDIHRLGEALLERASEIDTPRMLIAGEDDRLISSQELFRDSELGKFDFRIVPSASHFSMFDQPEAVARLIESFSRQREKG